MLGPLRTLTEDLQLEKGVLHRALVQFADGSCSATHKRELEQPSPCCAPVALRLGVAWSGSTAGGQGVQRSSAHERTVRFQNKKCGVIGTVRIAGKGHVLADADSPDLDTFNVSKVVFVVGPFNRGHHYTNVAAVTNALLVVTMGWTPPNVARLAKDHPHVWVPHAGGRGAIKFVGGTLKHRADFEQIRAAGVGRHRLAVVSLDTVVLPQGFQAFQPPSLLLPRPAPHGTCECSTVATLVANDIAIQARLCDVAKHSNLGVPTADKATWWTDHDTARFLSRPIGGQLHDLAVQSKSRDTWGRAKMLHRCLLAAHEGRIVEGKMGIDTHRFLIDGWHGLIYAIDPEASGHVIEPEDFATETAARDFFAVNHLCTQLGKVHLVVVKKK